MFRKKQLTRNRDFRDWRVINVRLMLLAGLFFYTGLVGAFDGKIKGLDPTKAEPGSVSWEAGLATVQTVVINGEDYNIIVGVHNDAPKAWPSHESAMRFNANVTRGAFRN